MYHIVNWCFYLIFCINHNYWQQLQLGCIVLQLHRYYKVQFILQLQRYYISKRKDIWDLKNQHSRKNNVSILFFVSFALFLKQLLSNAKQRGKASGQMVSFLDWKNMSSPLCWSELRRVQILCWTGKFFIFGDFSNWTCTSFKYKCVPANYTFII